MELPTKVIIESSGKESIEIKPKEDSHLAKQIDMETEKYFALPNTKDEENQPIEILQEEQTVEFVEGFTPLSEFCRTCANISDHLIPIFEEEGLQNDLFNKIQKYLPIELSFNDKLPLQLCYQCAAALLAWHELLEGCLAAESKLQNIHESLQKKQQYSEILTSNGLEVPRETVTSSNPAKPLKEDDRAVVSDSERWQAECTGNAQVSVIENPFADTEEMPCIECTQCDVTFTNVPSFVTHMNKKHGIELHYCNYCKVMYRSSIGVFEEHLLSHKIDSPIKRNQNREDEIYVNQNEQEGDCSVSENLPSNFNKSTGIDNYACNKCNRNFENKSDLEIHTSSHSDVKRLQNPEEVAMLNNARQMIDERVTYKCNSCGKLMFTRRGFLRHIRVHSDKRPCKCNECGKCYRIEQDLARHMRDVHERLKKHACDICGRTFANKGTKDDHRRIHTGERPYACEYCPKTFRTLNSIYIHNRVHNDYKPHKCLDCGKFFRNRQRLSNHMTTHTGVKEFPCEICGKLFAVKGEVMRHLAIHKEEKPFDCKNCGTKFGQKRYLKNHIKQHHKENALELLAGLENQN